MGKRASLSLESIPEKLEETIFHLWFFLQNRLRTGFKLWLFYRLFKKKEDKERLPERWGKTSYGHTVFERPEHPLLWIHVASVGEASAILDLAEDLALNKKYNILLTSATVSAQKFISQYLLQKHVKLPLFHQYAPLDIPLWVERFLNHWQPSGALFVESELWPVRLKLCQRRHIPCMLVGGRLSALSFKWWRHFPFFLRIILKCFSWISAKDSENYRRIQPFILSQKRLLPSLDLKSLRAPLPFDREEAQNLKNKLQHRKIFIAASTHEGEELFFAQAKNKLRKSDNWLFIFVPRHPERGQKISTLLKNAPLRGKSQFPTDSDDFWIIDTVGELGLFFAVAECAFVGFSLFPKGKGHNPYEPLAFHLPTCAGNFHLNWTETYLSLKDKITFISTEKDFLSWLANPVFFEKKETSPHQEKRFSELSDFIHRTILHSK